MNTELSMSLDKNLGTLYDAILSAEDAAQDTDTHSLGQALIRAEGAYQALRLRITDMVAMLRASLRNAAHLEEQLAEALESAEASNEAYQAGYEEGADETMANIIDDIANVKRAVRAAINGDGEAVEFLAAWAEGRESV